MKYGMIDIGSNTIRTVVYDVRGTDYDVLLNEREFAGIISYVRDGALTEEGVARLLDALADMAELCRQVGCDEVDAFATASLRNVHNAPEVLSQVKARTGLVVSLLSGEDEARYDYLGLRRAVKDSDGVGLDLGGGSGQIFCWRGNELASAVSLKIGSLYLFTRFVTGILPSDKERKRIKRYVREELETVPELRHLDYETLYAMGGTARAAAKLRKKLTGEDDPAEGFTIGYNELGELTKIIDNMGVTGVRIISQVLPERIHTIVPGIITLKTICKYTGAKELRVLKNGVREGYLWEKLQKN